MFVLHRKHTHRLPRSVRGVVLPVYMQVMLLPRKKHIRALKSSYVGSFTLFFILQRGESLLRSCPLLSYSRFPIKCFGMWEFSSVSTGALRPLPWTSAVSYRSTSQYPLYGLSLASRLRLWISSWSLGVSLSYQYSIWIPFLSMHAACPAYNICFDSDHLIALGEICKLWNRLCDCRALGIMR
jgi:hypothetical protein